MKNFTKALTIAFTGALLCVASISQGGVTKSRLHVAAIKSPTSGFSVSATSTNITCNNANNGTATANVSGGTPPYTYLWSNGATTSSISGLTAGTYTVYANDAVNSGGNATGTVSTLAGSGTAGHGNGTGTGATFSAPRGAATDGTNLYIADAGSNQIRKIVISTGVVTTLAGSSTGSSGHADGASGTAATFTTPMGLVYDGSGSLYVADYGNSEIRKVNTSTGATSTFAGSTTTGNTNGNGTSAKFWHPFGITKDGSGNLYVAEQANNDIRAINISTTAVTTLAGTGTAGHGNGAGSIATFNGPTGVACDGSGNLYVVDNGNSEIRVINISSTNVSNFAGSTVAGHADGTGTSASFKTPIAIVWDGGNNLYVADNGNNEIRDIAISTVAVTTVAGTTTAGNTNGTGATASFNSPGGITFTGNSLYVPEVTNNDVRAIVLVSAGSPATVTITNPSVLSASSAVTTPVLCNGGNGTVTVSASGGTSPYTGTGAFTAAAGSHTYTVTDANGCSTTTTITVGQPNAISVTATPGAIACNGGTTSVNVTATGGSGTYTSGTGTVTGVGAGTYTYTVTDNNGCTGSTTITISAPSTISVTATPGAIACNGGTTSVNVTATGGSGTYTSGTGTVTGVGAGTYTYTVTDNNGCTGSTTITISAPSTISVTATPGTIACNGGTTSVNVTATGGSGTYTSGTGTVTGVGAGTYTYTVTDNNGCTGSTTITISAPSVITASGSTMTMNCHFNTNGTGSVTASGGTGTLTYAWSPNVSSTSSASGLSAGVYTVNVSDGNGCGPVTAFVTVIAPPIITASGSTSSTSCSGSSDGSGSVTASGGTGTLTYAWSPNVSSTSSASGLSAGVYTVSVSDANGCGPVITHVTINSPAAISVTATPGAIACNGGTTSVNVTATGGSGTYTSGTGTVTGVGAGTYTYTVTDNNGCTGSTTITISAPSTISVTATPGTIACNGGTTSVNVTATGGSGTYTSGTGTVTGVGAGTYTYTVTDNNGCTGSTTITIGAPSAISVTATPGTIACNGGTTSVNVTATGGSGTYTSGTGTITGVGAGTYTYTVTDNNGCTGSTTLTISQPTVLFDSISGEYDVSCNGNSDGFASVGVRGGTAPYIYSWSNGETTDTVSDLSAGTYTVNVTDANSCGPVSATVTVNQSSTLVVTTSGSNVTCNGAGNGTVSATVSGGAAPYSYSWAPGYLISPFNGRYAATATNLGGGTYTVTVTDANGCSISESVTITEPDPITASGSTTSTSCSYSSDGVGFVSASGGTPAYTYTWSPNVSVTSSASGLSAGVYTVSVSDANGCTPATAYVTINSPNAITATISGTNASCAGNDGAATVTVTGGTPSYTYLWSDASSQTTATATGLTAGLYSVTINDANGCGPITDTITIGQSNATTVSVTPTSVSICRGDSTTLTASGASTYTWSPSTVLSSSTGASVTVNGVAQTVSFPFTGGLQSWVVPANVSQITVTAIGGAGGNGNGNAGGNGAQVAGIVSVTPGHTINIIAAGAGASYYGGGGGGGSYVWDATSNTLLVVAGGGGGAGYDYSGENGGNGQTDISNLNAPTTDQSGTSAPGGSGGNGGGVANDYYNFPAGAGAGWNSDGESEYTAYYGYIAGGNNPSNGAAGGSGGGYDAPGGYGGGGQGNLGGGGGGGYNGGGGGDFNNYYAGGGGGGSYCAGTISGTPVASNTGNGSVSITYTATGSTTYTVTGTSASGCTGTATVTVTVLPVPSVTTGVTNITCNGLTNGTATANVTGGTAPYNYVWSDASSQTTATATGLSAGTYSVTVTDANGCSSVVSVATVIEPAVMTVTTSSTRSTGSDGTATANVTGGTAPYSYVWSDASSQTTATATGLSVGSYTVIVNDVNGCGAVTDSITVIPTLVVNSVTEVATGCYNTNGTIIVNASGGIPPYTYYVTGYYTYGVIDNNGSSNTMPFPGPYCDYIQVQVTDANGYTAYLDWNYLCPDGTTPGNPALCYVTADTALEQNTINWSNSGLNLTDLSNFNIYKEETTGYVLVGTTIPSATSFVDATSHSDIESNYYQITATDTCGVESPISNNVETVLLQANWGVGSVVNLSWNAYQNSTGNVVAYYVILRDTGTGFHNYDSVPFNIYAYTDLKPTTGALQYMVNTVFNGLSCTSATSSHSNKKVIKVVTGINEIIASSSINVYPNPVSDQVTVAVNTNVDGMLSIVDVLGQVVYSDRIVSTGNTVKHIGTTGFTQGVYFLKITSNGQEVVKKFIKL